MSFYPVFPVAILVVAGLVGMALIWWPEPSSGRSALARRLLRTLLVLVVVAAALRPGMAGTGQVRVDSTDLNVFFVVDTTTSSVAEDHGGQTRLDGMRADMKAISGQLAGARFALITFDRGAVLRMPLTTDGAAVAAAADTMLPEASVWSEGSSVTTAGPMLQETLEHAQATHPERARAVFYLGDGEHTAADEPAPLGVDPGLVNAGGAVLGYGTSAGGRMQETGGLSRPIWVRDPATGDPARSVIDETRLADLADQMGVAYVHRSPGESIDRVVETVDQPSIREASVSEDGPLVGSRTEFYWMLALVAAGLLAIEAGIALSRLWQLRRPARKSLRRAER